jgi:hypothetical protein
MTGQEQLAAIAGENAERGVVELVGAVDALAIEDAGVERE